MAPIILPPATDPFWARFDAKVWRGEEIDCAIWTGARDTKGYGMIGLNGRLEQAHRIAFLRAGGLLTEDKPHVLHHCDRPSCTEFSCLFAGNHVDNAADKARKGRGKKSRCGLPYGVQPRNKGYVAMPSVNGRQCYLGIYPTVEEAAAVAMAAKKAYYGE